MEVGGQHYIPAALLPGRGPTPIEQEAGWAPEPVRTFGFGEKKNFMPQLGFKPGPSSP